MRKCVQLSKFVLLFPVSILIFSLLLPGCSVGVVEEEKEEVKKEEEEQEAVTQAVEVIEREETQEPQIEGNIIIVNSTADIGVCTLRQALLDAQIGDTVTFDNNIFPPSNPAVIYPISGLPPLTQGNLTIDASDAGVILDGNQAQGEWVVGIAIDSNNNAIYGLQIVNFSGAGIILNGGGNTIGGDR